MKTGTITFHAPNNNGSFFQAYALQTVLQSQLGVENEIIDFYSEKQMRQYSMFRKPKSGGDIGRNLISLVHYSGLKSRHERFDQMRKKHLVLSKRCTTEQEVYEVADATIRLSAEATKSGIRKPEIIQMRISWKEWRKRKFLMPHRLVRI